MKKSFCDQTNAKRMYDELVELSRFGAKEGQKYGMRTAGSEGDRESGIFISDKFKEAGWKVEWEPFDSITFEEYGSCFEMGGETFDARAFFYSRPTEEGGLEREVIFMNAAAPEEYVGVNAAGKILCFYRDEKELKENFWDELHYAWDKGVAGVVMINFAEHIFVPTMETGYLDPEKRLLTYTEGVFPAMVVSNSSGKRIKELFDSGVKTGKMIIDAHLGTGRRPVNVRAIKEGTDLKQEKILIYGHRDTVGTPGSADNGTGQVAMTELARILKNETFRRTVEIVSLSQEEELACLGSKAYLEAHAEDIPNIKAAFELDMVAGTGLMVMTGGHFRDIEIHYPQYLIDYCVERADEIGYYLGTDWGGLGTPDSARFHVAGIPTLWFWANGDDRWFHSNEDVPERLDINTFKAMPDIMAYIISELANADDVDAVIGKK